MPHRLHDLTATLIYICEGTLFTIGLMWSGGTRYLAQLVDQDTMNQLRSADGALFGAAVIVVALWLSKISDGKKMDKRHDEMIAVLKLSIKANVDMAHKLEMLVNELDSRPCAMKNPMLPHLRSINFDTTDEP
jgi:hypothetical protein